MIANVASAVRYDARPEFGSAVRGHAHEVGGSSLASKYLCWPNEAIAPSD
jgi:hypothetical protein